MTITRSLSPGFALGAASPINYRNAVRAVQITAANLAGWTMQPFFLPEDLDVSYPISLHVMLAAGPLQGPNPTNVVIKLTTARLAVADAPVETTFAHVIPVVGAWIAFDPILPLLDQGPGYTYPAHRFMAGDLVGMTVQRDGTDPLDTNAGSIVIMGPLRMTYTGRCRCGGIC